MFILPLLFIVLIVWFFTSLVNNHPSNGQLYPRSTDFRNNSNENSLELLKQRLAKGEISDEEYARVKRLLVL